MPWISKKKWEELQDTAIDLQTQVSDLEVQIQTAYDNTEILLREHAEFRSLQGKINHRVQQRCMDLHGRVNKLEALDARLTSIISGK